MTTAAIIPEHTNTGGYYTRLDIFVEVRSSHPDRGIQIYSEHYNEFGYGNTLEEAETDLLITLSSAYDKLSDRRHTLGPEMSKLLTRLTHLFATPHFS